MDTSAPAEAIVRATVELGRELGLWVVAEGVQTAEQRRRLTKPGCTAAQGFSIAEPIPADLLGEALAATAAVSLATPPIKEKKYAIVYQLARNVSLIGGVGRYPNS